MHDDAAVRPDVPVDHPDDEKEPMGEQLHRLYTDGRYLIEHELGFQKRRLKFVGQQGKSAAGLIVVALTFVVGGLLALILGVLLALIPVLGEWGATIAVTSGSLVVAVLAHRLAMSRIKSIGRVFAKDDQPESDGK